MAMAPAFPRPTNSRSPPSLVSPKRSASSACCPTPARSSAARAIPNDRIGPPTSGAPGERTAFASATAGWQQSVAAGLASLGWSAREADAAVAGIDPVVAAEATAAGDGVDVGRLLKLALRGLDRS